MKRIGKTFAQELSAAGLLGVIGSWGDDGSIDISVTATPEQRDAVQAVYDAHDPMAGDKSDQWADIQSVRDRLAMGGVSVGTKWFHTDQDSRIKYLGLKDRARDILSSGGGMTDNIIILDHPVAWKTMDGSFIDITAQLAFDIVAAVGDLDAQLFALGEMHKAALEVSADPASYDFTSGWPLSFNE